MTNHASGTNRRRFIKLTVAGLAAAPIGSGLLSGTAAAVETVTESNPQAALGYKMDATKAPKRTDTKAVCTATYTRASRVRPTARCVLFLPATWSAPRVGVLVG